MKGSIFSTHKSRHGSKPKCLHEGCIRKAYAGREYCSEHGYFCKCGKAIGNTAKFCSSCATKENNAKMTPEQRADFSRRMSVAQKVSPRGPLNELKEIIRSYEDAWLRGFYPDLAQLRLPVLRAQLKQMEQENVRTERKEATYTQADCS